MVRVVKPSGSIFVNLGDKYANPAGGGASGWEGGNWDRSKPQKAQNTLGMGFRQKSLMGLPWRYAIGCIDDLGLILRSEIVWSKPNGLPESVTDRVRRSHEQWFHFTLEPRYFSAIDEIREAYTSPPAKAQKSKAAESGATLNPTLNPTHDLEHNPLGKLPGSVWSIPSEPLQVPDQLGVDHFAAFPQEWPRRLILGWCPQEVCSECGEGRAPVVDKERMTGYRRGSDDLIHTETSGQRTQSAHHAGRIGDFSATITGYACACADTTAPSTPGVVLDPFVGTGTVPMVARALGRTGIGVDLSSDYLRLADWRIHESGHAAKTIRRTNQDRQGSLL